MQMKGNQNIHPITMKIPVKDNTDPIVEAEDKDSCLAPHPFGRLSSTLPIIRHHYPRHHDRADDDDSDWRASSSLYY